MNRYITEQEARASAKRCHAKAKMLKDHGIDATVFENQAVRYEQLAQLAKANGGQVDPLVLED